MILYTPHKFIKPEDVGWCFEQALAAPPKQSADWAHLCASLFDPSNPRHVELWLDCKGGCPAMARWCPEQVVLGSPEAQTLRTEYQDRERRRQRLELLRSTTSAPTMAPSEAVRGALDRCLADEPGLFWWLLDVLLYDGEGGHRLIVLPDTIYEHPGWKAAEASQRARIIEAARRYLRDAELHAPDLTQLNVRYRGDRAPPLAVHLLLQEDVAFLRALDPIRWRLIAPFLLLSPAGSKEARREAVELAYERAPEAVRDTAVLLIQQFRTNTGVFLLGSLEDCLDAPLADRILGLLRTGDYPPDIMLHLLAWLLRHNNNDARKLAES